MNQIKELGETLDYKRVAQNIKITVKELEKLEKAGMTVHNMTMRNEVPNTKYVVSYKVKTNPHKKLIAKKVLRRR
jgi:hypothetical protein